MEEVIEKGLRFRISISRGMKGQIGWEYTVDATGFEMDEVLAKSDVLQRKLEERYPMQEEK